MKKYQLKHQEVHTDCAEILKEYIVEENGVFIIDGKIEFSELPTNVLNSVLDWLNEFDPINRQNVLNLLQQGRIILECTETD
ncbi:MAG: hypothetical protein RBS73_04105 [Prolixibacteraceae bacterium]|jgi:hypothetical protein|nr:hypothetical protein [Prolixibacteraceae bacterium]